MRILHIVRQFNPAIGGLESFVECLTKQQRNVGHQVEVLTLNSVFHKNSPRLSAEEDIGEVPVRRIPWFGSYKYPIALSSIFHVRGYDIIHVHAVDFFSDYLPLINFYHRTPLVLSTHGGFFHSTYASKFKRAYFNTITRWSVRKYKRVIACSEGDRSLFSSICEPWLHLIENGVDVEKFFDHSSKKFKPNFIFIGRFSDNKRLDLLLKTFSYIKKTLSDFRLTIVGRDWDGNLIRLQQQVVKLDLANNVLFLLELNDDEIKSQIGHHCFVVTASDYEGFGMTLVEGMSAGLVPIASSIKSFECIIKDAGIGLLVDFHHPEIAASTIVDYIQSINPNYLEAREMSKSGSLRYGWGSTSKRFMHIYEEVLGIHYRVIQGVKIDTRAGHEVIELIEKSIKQNAPICIAVANAHTVNSARKLPFYCEMLKKFLVINDGIGVSLASKWKYNKYFTENLNGTDFIPRLLAETKPLRVFLIGAKPEVIGVAFRRLADKYTHHHWIGYAHGFLQGSEEAALIARIREASPDLLLVGMGNPLQEEWISKYSKDTGAIVCIGVGALFDFVSGEIKRAPLLVRTLKCEWLFRLVQEPRRLWHRYLIGNITFLWAALRDNV